MKKLSGIISFAGALFWFFALLYVFFESKVYEGDGDEKLFWVSGFVTSISGIYFTIVNRFWASKPSILDSLDKENEIIKKQIEKKELLAKLENLEKK